MMTSGALPVPHALLSPTPAPSSVTTSTFEQQILHDEHTPPSPLSTSAATTSSPSPTPMMDDTLSKSVTNTPTKYGAGQKHTKM